MRIYSYSVHTLIVRSSCVVCGPAITIAILSMNVDNLKKKKTVYFCFIRHRIPCKQLVKCVGTKFKGNANVFEI